MASVKSRAQKNRLSLPGRTDKRIDALLSLLSENTTIVISGAQIAKELIGGLANQRVEDEGRARGEDRVNRLVELCAAHRKIPLGESLALPKTPTKSGSVSGCRA